VRLTPGRKQVFAADAETDHNRHRAFNSGALDVLSDDGLGLSAVCVAVA
jgi:hypothetical protein